jgi:beta-glucanase (GH16 family)
MLGRPQPRLPWPDRGEIDIVEHVGHQPGVVHGSVHTGAFNHTKGNHRTGKTRLDDLASAFHVYWVQWDRELLTIGVDDKTVLTVHNDGQGVSHWPFDHPYFLILNIAVGGFWGGAEGVDPDAFPVRMVVDWVRVWQRADATD